MVEQCRLAEEVGFETCWVNDHQATEGDNYWPSPLTRLTSIATGTDNSVEDFEDLADDRFIYGTPDQIEPIQERFTLDQLTLRFHRSGTPKSLVEDQLRLSGEQVIPAFD